MRKRLSESNIPSTPSTRLVFAKMLYLSDIHSHVPLIFLLVLVLTLHVTDKGGENDK